MFTWEEAGQLRSMMQVVVWGVVVLVVATGTFVERKPITAGIKAAVHRVESVFELQMYTTGPVHQPRG